MFPDSDGSSEPNRLVIQLQPDEGMRLHMTAKEPGPGGIRLQPVSLDLNYTETFQRPSPDAYERLLMDVVRGNPTLFMRRDEVEAAWAWVEPILIGWQQSERGPRRYPAGTNGPTAATTLIERDGRTWHEGAHTVTAPSIPSSPSVTDRIIERSSAPPRRVPRPQIRAAGDRGPARGRLACANLAHGFAASGKADKKALRGQVKPNIAIVSAYNDMLSAHQPFERFPAQLKQAVLEAGGIAQFAGGVPAMCDGITQGRDGMQLSLFSRDVIAMSTAIALSHDMFDAALMLGVCDKIVPGLLIGALSFGHLPTVFVPAGPMTSGLPNGEKAKVRQLYAEGKVGREELLDAEAASYHGAAPAPSTAPPTPTSC